MHSMDQFEGSLRELLRHDLKPLLTLSSNLCLNKQHTAREESSLPGSSESTMSEL